MQPQLQFMHIIQQISFILLAIVSIWFFSKNVGNIKRNIFLGRDIDLSGHTSARWKRTFLLALGQKKMFKYPMVAVLHFFLYAGFIIINIEILEIVLDGMLGTHRLFAPMIGNLYGVLINCFEVLAVLVLIGCFAFFCRRNFLNIGRLKKSELNGFPRKDANIILIIEVILMSLFLLMNAADIALQQMPGTGYHATAQFIISSQLAPFFQYFTPASLIAFERSAWWLHIIGVFAFLNYLPYSKHLHIILGFPNTYYGNLDPVGKLNNMKEIQNEVLYAMQPELAPVAEPSSTMKFGAKDITDLTWKNLMEAYSCTECGRCTAACPANITGKKLSPRKVMMDTRDRMEEIGRNINKNGQFVDDGKTLLHDYITEEELRACTTCQACVEECPVSISPLDIIVQLRRHLIMEESNAPQEWNGMFSNVENNFAPWKFAPDDRDQWVNEMKS